MTKTRKKIKLVFFLTALAALATIACQPNQEILNSQPKATPVPANAPQQPGSFERALRGVESGDFTFIFVLRRKDGGELQDGDGRYIKSNSPPGANQFVVTDDNKTVIIGSNFPFSEENLEKLGERFDIENRSKPDAEQANRNAPANANK